MTTDEAINENFSQLMG